MIQETIGPFGFHLVDETDELHPIRPNVRLYVKSSTLSRAADLAITAHLTTEADIDRFVDEAIAALQTIRVDAKRALGKALQS
jgi:hypothetical protein